MSQYCLVLREFCNNIVSFFDRLLGEDSDSDFRDSSSDGSSDCEPERGLKYLREQRNLPHLSDEVPHRMGRLSLRDHHILPQDGFSSDDGESGNSQGYLLFEYLERDPPYSREPLADKVYQHYLASLLPSSSVLLQRSPGPLLSPLLLCLAF